ncbi:MAG: MMPL family transporter [Hyphomicrobiaceae bacterium]
MSEPADEHESFALGLGLEKIGLVALRWPVVMFLIMAAVTALSLVGISRIKVDDSLTELFRTSTPEFKQYESLSTRFPSSEYDVLVVVEGQDLLARDKLERLRTLATDLQLIDSVNGVVSLFSARTEPEKGKIPPPLFPDDLPSGAAYDELIAKVRANEIIKDKLLSADGTLALIVMALDHETVVGQGLAAVVGEIEQTVNDSLEGTGLVTQLSGAPVMQLEIRNAVANDQMKYNGLGLLIGAVIAIIFYRRVSLMLLTAFPPVLAIIWSIGLLGWLDVRLNLFLNVMGPLIMVMGFSDSMQIVFAMRDRIVKGASKREALEWSLKTVGPACVLTDGTACLSFVALLVSDSALIRTFGWAGALSTIMSFLAVILIIPLLGLLLLRNEEKLVRAADKGDRAMRLLEQLCTWVADRVIRKPAFYAMIGFILLGVFGLAHATLDARYRLADQVPDAEQAMEASNRLDAKLTGASPVHIMIDLPQGVDLFSPEVIDVIGAVHRQIEAQPGIGNVWSIETLRRWLEEKAGERDIAVLKSYVEALPEHLVRRFISADQRSVVVTGRLPDLDASSLLPIVDQLDASLATIREAHPGYQISVTGLPVIAARNSASMIGQLNWSLTGEIVFVAALIGLAFRSFWYGALSLLPGLFPVVASGALLAVTGEGLQFASVIALVVAFGLGLDATIHYLNRLRLEDRPDEDPAIGVRRATLLVGPALILTTIVLAFGLAVTMFSDLPSLRVFGRLCAITLAAALIGDLVFLPATVVLVRRFARRGRSAAQPAKR